MTANELRIGNIINFGVVLEPIMIKAIDPDSPTIEMAEPIPLTEEWLLRFGFREDVRNERVNDYEVTDVRFCIGDDSNYCVKFSRDWYGSTAATPDKHISFYSSFDYIKEIDYVHQLQNLYFALTGKELEIK